MFFPRGLAVPLEGLPDQTISDGPRARRVGLVGSDYRGLRADPLVAEGDAVEKGQIVVQCRKRSEIRLPSPVSGIVESIEVASGRRLTALTIREEGDAAKIYVPPKDLTRDASRTFLIETGQWCALTERPYGSIPQPDADPDALCVVAVDSNSGAPDPRVVITDRVEDFREGVHLLRHLTDAAIWIVQAPGDDFVSSGGHVRVHKQALQHPGGLTGSVIDHVCPLKPGGRVWSIGYADVLEIGALMRTGTIRGEKVVALSGPVVVQPRLVRQPVGALLADALTGEVASGPRRTLSGPPLTGLESRFLRRGHNQITALPRILPRRRKFPLLAARKMAPAPIIPHAALDAAMGIDLPVMPLIRALSTQDVDEAERLGAKTLLEEDLALLSYVTGGDDDFPRALRNVLDALEARE